MTKDWSRAWLGLVLLSLPACRRDEPTPAEVEVAAASASPSPSPRPSPSGEPAAAEDAAPEPAVEPPPTGPLEAVPADTLIQLERTACLGKCPTYLVSIRADGTVFFHDEGTKGGCASFKVSRAALGALIEQIRDARYFQLKPKYDAGVTDHPSAKTFVRLGGRSHRVDHYLADSFAKGSDADERKRLTAIEKQIDALAKSKQWLGPASSLPGEILYTEAEIEAVAASNAAALASECLEPSAPRGTLDVEISIDGTRHVYDSEGKGGPWFVGRAGGVCSSDRRHPSMSCVCREIRKWEFPPGCGTTAVRLRIDFDGEPPTITVARRARPPKSPRVGPHRSRGGRL